MAIKSHIALLETCLALLEVLFDHFLMPYLNFDFNMNNISMQCGSFRIIIFAQSP